MPAHPHLPRADQAIVPREKLEAYALNLSHERGKHKARVFASALAITTNDWRYLRNQILERVATAPVRGMRVTGFGAAYEVVVTIDGLNGASHPVVTAWIIEAAGPPRLTSTWVDIP